MYGLYIDDVKGTSPITDTMCVKYKKKIIVVLGLKSRVVTSRTGYRHKSSRKLKRNQPHKRSKTMQIVRKSYARKLKLPKNPRNQQNLALIEWG
jgi:hypothetical protein